MFNIYFFICFSAELYFKFKETYLDDLEDGLLVDRQAGKGVLAEALCKGTKWPKMLCIDLQQKAIIM